MTILIFASLALALGFVHVVVREIRWQKKLAEMAREVRERHEQA